MTRWSLVYLFLWCYLFAATFGQSCPNGKYGADCSCNADLTPFVSGTANCSNGIWTVVGNVSIPDTRILNVSYDQIFINGSLNLLGPSSTIVVSISISNVTSNTRTGYISMTGDANFNNGVLRIVYDLLTVGNWSLPIMSYGVLLSKFDISALLCYLPPFQQNCLNATTSIEYTMSVIIVVDVMSTGVPCANMLPDRTGVLIAIIISLALAFLISVFMIITCCIKPVKKKTWQKWED
jgi:hypothetical protein